jgi:hypothetical protein
MNATERVHHLVFVLNRVATHQMDPISVARQIARCCHPQAVFRRALERGNLLVAETTLREVGRPTLEELLLTASDQSGWINP